MKFPSRNRLERSRIRPPGPKMIRNLMIRNRDSRRLKFLNFRPWVKELVNSDCRFGFLVKNCIYSQLNMSRIPKFGPKIRNSQSYLFEFISFLYGFRGLLGSVAPVAPVAKLLRVPWPIAGCNLVCELTVISLSPKIQLRCPKLFFGCQESIWGAQTSTFGVPKSIFFN